MLSNFLLIFKAVALLPSTLPYFRSQLLGSISNFVDSPLYLFRRGGTTLPFNGHFYGAVIRFGPNLPIETIQQTEAYMAAKTGVTLA